MCGLGSTDCGHHRRRFPTSLLRDTLRDSHLLQEHNIRALPTRKYPDKLSGFTLNCPPEQEAVGLVSRSMRRMISHYESRLHRLVIASYWAGTEHTTTSDIYARSLPCISYWGPSTMPCQCISRRSSQNRLTCRTAQTSSTKILSRMPAGVSILLSPRWRAQGISYVLLLSHCTVKPLMDNFQVPQMQPRCLADAIWSALAHDADPSFHFNSRSKL